MTSWFSFTSNVAPSEETSSQISNLEATISTLEGTVDGLKTIVLKLGLFLLAKGNDFFNNK